MSLALLCPIPPMVIIPSYGNICMLIIIFVTDLKNLLRIWVKSSSMSPLLVEQLSVEVIQRHASGQFSAIEALQHLSIVPQALEGIHVSSS